MYRLLGQQLSRPAVRPSASVKCAPTAPIADVPLCRKCAHFLKDETFREDSVARVRYGYCALYGSLDVVSGERSYEYAMLVRGDDDKCGISAKYYEEAGGAAEADEKQ